MRRRLAEMSTRGAVVVIFGGAAVLLVAVLVLGRWVVHGPVTAVSLQRSVAIEAGSLSGHECRRLPPRRTWECSVSTDGGSSRVPYFVVVEPGSSCWHARLTERRYPGDKPVLRGCVHLWQWRILDV